MAFFEMLARYDKHPVSNWFGRRSHVLYVFKFMGNVNVSKKVDWYYYRGGWTSCTKASKFLEASNIEIKTQVPASKKLQATDGEEMLLKAVKLIALKGKKVSEFSIKSGISEEAIAAMLGPTGNLRAPTLKVGKTIIVGYNEAAYLDLFSWRWKQITQGNNACLIV